MTRLVWDADAREGQGDWVPRRERAARRGLMVISDAIDPVRSMASGRMHDSKSALRAEYRQLGVYEIGNDTNDAAVFPTHTHDHRTGRRWDEMR